MKLGVKEAQWLVEGATILGVGGGGDPEAGLNSNLFCNVEKSLFFWSLEVNDNDLLVSPYYVGSVAKRKVSKTQTIEEPFVEAISIIERFFGKKVGATVPSEIGGGNTAAALAIASQLDIPTVDGDLMGRAGPELHQSTIHIFGIPPTPTAIVSESGNKVLVEATSSVDDYESIARHISVISGGHAAVVDTPLTKELAKKCVIPNTLSLCIQLGMVREQSEEKGKDPVQAVVSKLKNGKVIFKGVVSKYKWEDKAGFLFGEATLEGVGEWRSHTLKSWIKNEHIFAFLDDKPYVMPPDLYTFVTPRAKGITNDALKEGMEVVVIGASAPEIWRSEAGLKLFGPRHFGFDYDYVPFEKLAR
ncbi:hypothetical protein B9Q13_01060 [Candidatus Marsarchaeota G2 archaeon ECH_B_SAG-G16]|uniref:DUF917 domain-containing protein n=1 Tax=Candidatus Marsarchaeota G2 archaeon ECH_B_SAG-G16 TaxID=1978167 RepID=A0A2R6C489_9ARCH|nr:MAG: hypothetical protein B9Q13_01060 [Candidatus Marsarchaeota G2 archaeon ECH_B_SAG-G16]